MAVAESIYLARLRQREAEVEKMLEAAIGRRDGETARQARQLLEGWRKLIEAEVCR